MPGASRKIVPCSFVKLWGVEFAEEMALSFAEHWA
jgi:hypothetical protein